MKTADYCEDQQVYQVYQLATSVTGIGLQTAAYLIVHTKCFSGFDNWRKLAASAVRMFCWYSPV